MPAIIIGELAKKAMERGKGKGEPESDGETPDYASYAEGILSAVKNDDAESLAEILESYHHECMS